MACTTQTLLQIKSQEMIGHIKQHFMITVPLTYVTIDIQDFVKCYIKSWVNLDLRPDNMLCGELESAGVTKLFSENVNYTLQ